MTDNLTPGAIWEARLYPGQMVKILETSPTAVIFERLKENGWVGSSLVSRSIESFPKIYEFSRDKE